MFAGDDPGFDAIVGNPPFAGKNTLINGHREHYLDWLQAVHEDAHANADLVAHFFRRAFRLLRKNGCFGLIATNTIGQGDTRESGLRWLLQHGGSISRAVRRVPWPGEAAVVVSVVHVMKGKARSPVLDGRQVRRISAYLVEGDLDSSPSPLAANAGKAFQGCILLGLGFTFDDGAAAKGKASPVAEMQRLIAKDSRNAERIFPYLGGEEVNNDPRHVHRRWCIDFANFPLRRAESRKTWSAMDERERAKCRSRELVPLDYPGPVAADWPDLLTIIERLVKPERETQGREVRRIRWWQFAEKAMGLRSALTGLGEVVVISLVTPHLVFAIVETGAVFTHKLAVFTYPTLPALALFQSRLHEVWARAFASTLEDRLNYSPSDCVETFPVPERFMQTDALICVATEYHRGRSSVMVQRNEGLTKTYNRFHNHSETAPGIQYLRQLHHQMDRAVLRAYGWHDLADTAAPEFLTEETEPDHRYQDRLFWPAPFRDEVLARLLALNAERAAAERAAGIRFTASETEPELSEAT